MKKIFGGMRLFLLCSLCLAGISTYASTGTGEYTGALLPYLSAQESGVANLFDTTYDKVYTFFSQSGLTIIKSVEYQSLVCLGAMTDQSLLSQMQTDKLAIKTSFSKDFLELKNQIQNIEEKNTLQKTNNVILFASGTSYEGEKAKIKDQIDAKVAIHTAVISGFATTYVTKTTQFISDFQQYISSNASLIQSIANKISKVQTVNTAFALVESTIAKITAKITGVDDLTQKIETTKINGTKALDTTIDTLTTTTLKKYKKIQTPSNELTTKKLDILDKLQIDVDEYLSSLLTHRYNHNKYLDLKAQVHTFSSKFYTTNGQLNCTNIITAIDETPAIMTKIANMNAEVNSGLVKIEKEGVNATLQNQMYSGFQTTYIQKYKQRYAEFQTYLSDYIKIALRKLTQSTSETDASIDTSTPIITDTFIPQDFPNLLFTKAFKNGQYHNDIKALQNILTTLGFYVGVIDGKYNKTTVSAVYKFQVSKGLVSKKNPKAWGYFGPATRKAINNLTK